MTSFSSGNRASAARWNSCAACELRKFAFCAALGDEELAALESIVRPVRLTSGQVLFQEGDEADSVFNVTAGTMRVYKLLPDGRRQITGFLFPPDYLGISAIGAYAYSAEAVTDVELCRFGRPELDALFSRFAKLERRLLNMATDELTAVQDQMLLLGRKSASEKLASFLLGIARRARVNGGQDSPVPVPMTRTDIADYLGLTIETVSRVLGRFKRSGIIEIAQGRSIVLTRRDKLEEIAEAF
jgi:CRP/FNR family transcriptional regulator